MMARFNVWFLIRLAVIAATLVSLGWGAQAAEFSAELKRTIAAAKTEGRLILQWTPSTLGGSETVEKLSRGMNAMFALNLNVRYTPDPGSIPRSLNKIMVSQKAGRPSPSDLFLGTTTHMALVKRRNAAIAVPWPDLLPGRITEEMVEAGGIAVRVYTTLPGGIIYNTQKAPFRPTRLTDLLKPEWKGKIASTPYAASFDILSTKEFWGEQRMLDFARKLSQQISGLIGCPDLERVASGEYLAFAMDCSGRDWVKLKRSGAPIDFVVPADYSAQRYYYMTIPKNAQQPNAAKLFVVYLLTSGGQKILWDADDDDLHMFPDSGMRKVVENYESQGIKFKEITVDWTLAHPDARKAQVKAIKILRKR